VKRVDGRRVRTLRSMPLSYRIIWEIGSSAQELANSETGIMNGKRETTVNHRDTNVQFGNPLS